MYKDEHYHLKQQKPISDYLFLELLQDQNDETKLLLSIFLPKCKRNPRQGILRPTSFTHLAYLTEYIVHILVIHKHRKNCNIVLILSTGSKSTYAIHTNVMSQTVLYFPVCTYRILQTNIMFFRHTLFQITSQVKQLVDAGDNNIISQHEILP